MISTWADPLVRVNRQKEDSIKLKIFQVLEQIRGEEKRIGQLKKELGERECQAKTIMIQSVSPGTLWRIFSYCKYIQQEISQAINCLEKFVNEGDHLREELKIVAQKRILLESVQEKHIKKAMAEIAKCEENFMSEITRSLSEN